MKFAKACLPLVLGLTALAYQANGAVAYSNIPANPPFYSSNSGSTIFGALQDPNMMMMSGSIAMSFVPNTTGTLSSLTLGITVQPGADGTVNVFLAENPMTVMGVTTFGSMQAV